jgi:hypothetical protein
VNKDARSFCLVRISGRLSDLDGFEIKPEIALECMLKSGNVVT